ncbi:MAG: YdeI/OmpD-associated family protein [Candidatus Pacebacteria bacterium]|nr:YdeI/OmpD-associated family protein [Candidatus Paceibacterota bacterium]
MSLNSNTAFHDLNDALKNALVTDEKLIEIWNSLTDIQRNEWVCYTTLAKQESTRDKRVVRAIEDLQKGKRSPCCWPGCPHRRTKAAKFFK